MKKLITLILIVALIASCGSLNNFNNRKYLKLNKLDSDVGKNAVNLNSLDVLINNNNVDFPSVDSIKLNNGEIITGDIISIKIKKSKGSKKGTKGEGSIRVYKVRQNDSSRKKIVLKSDEITEVRYDNLFQLGRKSYRIDGISEGAFYRKKKRVKLLLEIGITHFFLSTAILSGGIVIERVNKDANFNQGKPKNYHGIFLVAVAFASLIYLIVILVLKAFFSNRKKLKQLLIKKY